VRWYLRYGLSYRDVEELLGERGTEVDHVTIYRWVQRFTPLLADAAGPCRHAVGGRWFVDETYVKVAGQWRYVYRAVDQYGQIVDVYVSSRRDFLAARRFFARAIRVYGEPVEIVTDRAPALRAAIEGLIPAAFHDTGAVREQPRRVRPRPTQSPTPSHARTRTRPHRPGDHARPRADAEPPPRTLRTRRRRASSPEGRARVHRTRPDDLTGNPDRASVPNGPIQLNATVPLKGIDGSWRLFSVAAS
jgi:transposase-like protein